MIQKFKDGFLSYEETCATVKRFGVVPVENPSSDMVRKICAIIDKCLSHYKSLFNERKLKGIFLYREEEQAGDLRKTYGCCMEVGEGVAVIGLCYGILEYNMPVFHDIVFLHELAHLSVWSHNEAFQACFNDLEFDYFFYNRVRLDSKAQPKPYRAGWKM